MKWSCSVRGKQMVPGCAALRRIRPLAEETAVYAKEFWNRVRALSKKPGMVLVVCGFPCREFSALNQTRRGLDHGKTARLKDAKAIMMEWKKEQSKEDPALRISVEM